MPEYYNVTTNLGDAEIANAIATNTKLNITHIAFGDGNGSVPIPAKARTSLVREVHRQAVTKYERHATNANWIVIETIIPSDVGGFTIREMGIIANGKLISHGSHAPFEKVADPSGVSEYRLRFTQNVTDGSVVELTLDESLIYATQAWIDENYIKRSEIVDNLTTNEPAKPVSAKQAKVLQDTKLGKTENAASATKLQTARTVSFSGAATGSFNFDGSGNSSCVLALANSGVVASTYGAALKIPVLTVNAKGLITGVSEQNIPIVDDLTTDDGNKPLSSRQGKKLQDEKFPLTGGTLNGSMHAIAVSARGMPDYSPTEQGAYLSWNRTDGQGETDFINHKGGGFGGFDWWNGNQYGYTFLMNLDPNGVLSSTGGFAGNANTATKLKTSRNIALSGAVSGNIDFDGSGNVEIITVPNTNELRVVEGSGYTITYDDYRRIAIIELTLWTNQSITGQTIAESHATNRYQIYSLPITLKKRLSVDIQLSEGGTTTSYYAEAGEWLRYAMQDGYRGYDAKTKLFVWFKRWSGSDDQPISANATIVGIF